MEINVTHTIHLNSLFEKASVKEITDSKACLSLLAKSESHRISPVAPSDGNEKANPPSPIKRTSQGRRLLMHNFYTHYVDKFESSRREKQPSNPASAAQIDLRTAERYIPQQDTPIHVVNFCKQTLNSKINLPLSPPQICLVVSNRVIQTYLGHEWYMQTACSDSGP